MSFTLMIVFIVLALFIGILLGCLMSSDNKYSTQLDFCTREHCGYSCASKQQQINTLYFELSSLRREKYVNSCSCCCKSKEAEKVMKIMKEAQLSAKDLVAKLTV